MLVRRSCESDTRRKQRGQTLIFVVLVLGLVLVAAMGIAVDLGNVWFHRQAAQTAADAACTAGVMDMLYVANGRSVSGSWWSSTTTNGTVIDCNGNAAAPCWYAAKNGYAGASGNSVKLTMLSDGSSWGAKTEPGDSGFESAGIAPFLQVDVVDHVRVYFLALLGPSAMDVPARSGCGLQLANAPIPILVLDPTSSGSMSSNGNGKIKILGGPEQSIQVNSGNANAVANLLGKNGNYGGPIDLTEGGPTYSGSSLGVTGGPMAADKPAGFATNPPGAWMSPSAPISDPFSTLAPPSRPGPPSVPADLAGKCSSADIQAGNCTVSYPDAVHGCPYGGGCTVYTAGVYPGGIKVKGDEVAVFDPGVYYLEKSLWLASNSIARTSKATGDGSGGTMFYLTGTPTGGSCKDLLCVEANAGIPKGGMLSAGLGSFDIYAAQCPAPKGAPLDPALVAKLNADGANYTNLNGNLLLAPCNGAYGDPSGKEQYRGMLFFADRSKAVTGSWSGGGESLMAGNAYFHHLSVFDSAFVLQGNSCSSSYVLGEIVADRLDMGGNPCINMVLNPNVKYSILKAALMF